MEREIINKKNKKNRIKCIIVGIIFIIGGIALVSIGDTPALLFGVACIGVGIILFILAAKLFNHLSEEECFACIAHELGHLLDPTPSINNMPSEERELNADKIVIELGLQEHLISALKKLCVNDSPEQKLLTDKRIKVLEESHN